ncbi:MAG: prolipoprotein diacylglyceryl transferase [Planctomycetota bacterium]|nr:prolipoprotein diacylglyceryl transferase [Planctomycetota bacterium]
MGNPAYGLLMLAGIACSAWVWSRLTKPSPELSIVYMGGLLGALLGAKLVYLLAELPLHRGEPDFWMQALVGRTVTGGLLGGYVGVELAKRLIGHTRPTGDLFAVIVPMGLVFGRIGCFISGCCLGQRCQAAWYTVRDADGCPRWPASLAEGGFNLLAAGLLALLWRRGWMRHQLFHLYLIAYGLFRFGNEFLRDDPRLWPASASPVVAALTSYHLVALVIVAFGAWRFAARRGQLRRDLALAPSC